jgi:hypothetical protein
MPDEAAFPPDADGFVDVWRISPHDDVGAFVRWSALRAAAFLSAQSWWRGMRGMFFGVAVLPTAVGFLVYLREPVGEEADEWIWVVAGRVPAAYMVPDRILDPLDAMRVYCQLARGWGITGSSDQLMGIGFPFQASRDAESLREWLADVTYMESVCEKAIGAVSVPGLVYAKSLGNLGAQVECGPGVGGGSLRPGVLALDHRGSVGIVLGLAPSPSSDWLALQRDARFRSMATSPWWLIAPLSGGAIQVPQPLV